MKHSLDDPRRSLHPPDGGRDDVLREVMRKKEQAEPVPPCGIGWICNAKWYKVLMHGVWAGEILEEERPYRFSYRAEYLQRSDALR